MGAVVGYLNTQAGASRNIKPSAWPWQPSSVRPEWQSLLKGLTFAAPLWKHYLDYISGLTATPDAGTGWSTSTSGVSYLNAEDLGLDFGSNGSVWRPNGDAEFSVFLAFHAVKLFEGFINYNLFSQSSSETTNGHWSLLRPVLTNNAAFQWRVGGASQSVIWTDGWFTERPFDTGNTVEPAILRSYVVTRKIGGTYELWVQGVSAGTKSNATAPVDSGTHPLRIGNLDGGPTKGLTGHWMTAMLWDRALTDGEARRLGEDPYGFWRPPDTYLG